MNRKETEVIGAYVAAAEQPEAVQITAQPIPGFETPDPQPQVNVSETINGGETKMARMAREARMIGKDTPSNGDGGFTYKDNLGMLKLDVADLPTKGKFYPVGTEILIRAARGAEIKHWSTMGETDIRNLARTDDILNYMISRCVTVRIPGMDASWKDLKDVDRLYLLLAIREFTFLDGENALMIPISEGVERPIVKEDVDFIEIPDRLMKFYNQDGRCFTFTVKNSNRKINMYIPSLGVSDWVKQYYLAKSESGEGFDADFILFAPLLISDYRRLNEDTYRELVESTGFWTAKEWSIVSEVRNILTDATAPKFKFKNENGVEEEVPLNFRGGTKALFTVYDPLRDLC